MGPNPNEACAGHDDAHLGRLCPDRTLGLDDAPAMSVREIQDAAWQNKLDKGFNTADVPLEFCYLYAEMGEAFDAWRKGRPDVGEELADVALFVASIARMVGVDLQADIEAKLAKNAGRTYVAGPSGFGVRVDHEEGR